MSRALVRSRGREEDGPLTEALQVALVTGGTTLAGILATHLLAERSRRIAATTVAAKVTTVAEKLDAQTGAVGEKLEEISVKVDGNLTDVKNEAKALRSEIGELKDLLMKKGIRPPRSVA